MSAPNGNVKIEIDGKVYSTSTLDEISLRDVVMFDSQARAMGLDATFSDVERIAGEMAELAVAHEAAAKAAKAEGTEEPEEPEHPGEKLMFAVTIWAARRIAGEDVTLEQTISIPMKSIKIIEAKKAPKDRMPKKSKPRSIRPASGPVTGAADSEQSPTDDETTPQISPSSSASA